MEDCIFCKIINKEIPSTIIFENDEVVAFKDLNPVAPVHVLVVPKIHIESSLSVDENNSKHIAKVMESIKDIAKILDIDKDGFRMIINTGENGGQTVKHFHVHIIGGVKLPEKMV